MIRATEARQLSEDLVAGPRPATLGFNGEHLWGNPPTWTSRRVGLPIHIVSDFNNGLSIVECEQAIREVYRRNGHLYEPPHNISDIRPFNITDGAFHIYQLLRNQTHAGLPAIFVGVVDPGVGSARRGIAVTTREGYSFIGPDNGLFSPALDLLDITSAHMINESAFSSSVTFHGRDQFAPIAAELATGRHPSELRQLEQISPEGLVRRQFQTNQVVSVDGYGNIKIWARGIPKNVGGLSAKEVAITKLEIQPKRTRSVRPPIIAKVAKTFEDVGVGDWLVYEGSSDRETGGGLLEVAVRERAGKLSAARGLGIDVGDLLNLTWIS